MKKTNPDNLISKEDCELLVLALKCKFITSNQEKEILSRYTSIMNEASTFSVVKLFKGLKILTQSEIDFLLSIQAHLKNKFLDIKFGKLAVANQFTAPNTVKKALNQQISYFKKTKKHLSIGDLLVQNKKLSEADRIAILLTQDRIKDELLEQAMSKLAVNELEKIAINKRFGSIAVRNGYVPIEDVNKALKLQKEEKEKGHKSKYLGQILEEQFNISHEDTIKILKEQKVYEKKRLNLEKALNKFILEVKANQTISKVCEYTISKDKREAYICIIANFSEEIGVHNIINWIKLMGIQFGIVKDNIIEEFLIKNVKGSKLKIAQGIAPEEGKDAIIKFFFDYEESSVNDDKKKSKQQIIKRGKVLARKTPHQDGKPGKNVFGQVLLPTQPNIGNLRCGKGVATKDDHFFVARSDGYPVLYNNNTLFVTPISENRKTIKITDDITHKTDDVYREINLEITGAIHKSASIKCHNLKLNGNTFGNIDVAGDLEIKGKISAINLAANFKERGPEITALGSISITKSVENSIVACGGIFQAINSDIISSEIGAQHGIYCKNVYTNGSHPSILKFGKTSNRRLLQIQSAIEKRAKILAVLRGEPELIEIEQKLHQQISIQDKYRERQRVLSYLINFFGSFNLENIDTSESGFDFLKNSKEDIDDEFSGAIPKETKAYDYLQEIMDKLENLPPDVQLKKVQEHMEENYGMYKSAANITEKIENEFLDKNELIKNRVASNKSKLDQKEKELNRLCFEKDYLLLQESLNATGKTPEIKIKNQLSEGTMIIGKFAKLEIEKTIYGVRINERLDPKTNLSKIDITGYFE